MKDYIPFLIQMRNEVQKRDSIDVDDFVQLCDLLIYQAQKKQAPQGDQLLRKAWAGVSSPPVVCAQDAEGKPAGTHWTKQPCEFGVDQDGCCERCGLELEDLFKTEQPHVCPPGFMPRAKVTVTNRGRIEAALRKLGVTSADSQYDQGRWRVEDLAEDLSRLLDTSDQRVQKLEAVAKCAKAFCDSAIIDSDKKKALRDAVKALEKK